MKPIAFAVLLCFCCLCGLRVQGQIVSAFEKNCGQWDKDILYCSDLGSAKAYIREDRLTFVLLNNDSPTFNPHGISDTARKENYSVFSLRPFKADRATIEGKDVLPYYNNYFIGKDKSKHCKRVPSYNTITYSNIYHKTDWVLSFKGKTIKHSFVLHPGAKVSEICVEYIGVQNIESVGNALLIKTENGTVREEAPYIIQTDKGDTTEIGGRYVVKDNTVCYDIDAYNPELDLEIDPGLIFSTYIGSHSDSWGMTSCYDALGRIVSGGIVKGGVYPISEGAYCDQFSGNWDCVITKYNENASQPVFSTFLGGGQGEMPHSMTVNNNGELVILGTTGSNDFPVSDNAFQICTNGGSEVNYEQTISYPNGSDIFLTCLAPGGDSVLASTFIGGSDNDGLNLRNSYNFNWRTLYNGNDSLYYNYGDIARGEVITDNENNVYFASCSFSSDFPTTTGCFQNVNHGRQEAVAVKMDRSLSHLIYSTYIGGANDDAAYSIELDSQRRLYVTGGTNSVDFPVSNTAYNNTYNGGSADAFLCLLSANGTELEGSSFFGSEVYDQSYFVRTDNVGNPYIFGQTKASDYTLIFNAQYNIPNSGQFVAKFSPLLDSLRWSTVFGSGNGMINISPSGFAVDICNRIYCSGWGRVFKYYQTALGYSELGTSNLQTSSDAYSSQSDGQDFYIMAMEEDASALNYATYFGEIGQSMTYGADHVDGGTSRFDRYGNLYQTICASCGGSQGMPTSDSAYSSANLSDNCNIVSVKFAVNDDFAVADFLSPSLSCKNSPVNFVNISRAQNYSWDFGDGSVSTEVNPVHSYSHSGLYEVRLIANIPQGCTVSDTVYKNILILSDTCYFIDTVTTCSSVPVRVGLDYHCNDTNSWISYRWTPSELVSDSTIIDPYYIGTEPCLLTLIADNGECKDTIRQFVKTTRLVDEVPDTLRLCSLPFSYLIPTAEGVRFEASFNNNFDSVIEVSDGGTIEIADSTLHYLYLSYTKDNCHNVDSIYIDFKLYDFELDIVNTGCSRDNNGSAEVVSHSFPTEVHYLWSCSSSDENKVENLAVGTYTVTVRDENGCSLQKTFEIGSYNDLTLNYEKTDNVCENVHNGTIALQISGGASPYEILCNNNQCDTLLANLSAGTYVVTVTDRAGCVTEDTIEIVPRDTLKIVTEKTMNRCPEGCSARIGTNIWGGTEPYFYTWSNGEHSAEIYDLCDGTYFLEVNDANGCVLSAQEEITSEDVTQDFQAWASVYNTYDNNNVDLYSTYLEGFEYSWTPSAGLSAPNEHNTKARPGESTTYTVYATDNKGCSVQAQVEIKVEYVQCGEPNIFIANSFTPNNDGKNDFIVVSGEYIAAMHLAIYDRWGEKVWESFDRDEKWDGTFRGQPCQAGVYYYKLEIDCEGGKNFVKGGDITLIR